MSISIDEWEVTVEQPEEPGLSRLATIKVEGSIGEAERFFAGEALITLDDGDMADLDFGSLDVNLWGDVWIAIQEDPRYAAVLKS